MRNTPSNSNGNTNASIVNGANRLTTLTKDQIEQAKLVSKLPNDFPVARWESMNTKQQLQAMKNSGLNPKEQWSLLNASAPLSALSQHNQAQTETETRAYVARSLTQIAQSATVKTGLQNTKYSNSSSLQITPQQRKLDMLQEEHDTKFLEKAAGRMSPPTKPNNTDKSPTTYKPLESPPPKNANGDTGKKETWIDKLASLWDSIVDVFTPEKEDTQTFTLTTLPPTKTPRMTPTPRLTPKATPTPTPTLELSERQILADKGVTFAIKMIGKPYSNSGRYGEKGYDCSGLVVDMCKEIGSSLPFDQGIRTSCKYGMSQDFRNNPEYGSVEYDYTKGGTVQQLQKGDLIFYANPDKLKQDVHVAIATGELLYDSKTKTYLPEVIEASAYAKKVTKDYPAYNIYEDGHYVREHSDQVVTYVIRPNYDWKEQP